MEFKIKSFKELTKEELYKILEARIGVFVIEQNCPYQECDNKDQKSFHLYAQDENEIKAYLRIIPAGISYSEPSVGRVLVNKNYRRSGIGAEMMKKAIEFVKDNFSEDKLRISAQEYILDFYRKLGFEVVSDRYLEDGIPHFEMIYKL